MGSRSDKNSFPKLPRKREDCTLHMVPRTLIQQAVIPSSRRDLYLTAADHIVEPVCVDTRRIYHESGSEDSLIRNKLIAFLKPSDLLYFCTEPEFCAVGIRILCQGDIQLKGADDSP